MKPNTAAGFAVLGAALWLASRPSGLARRFAQACAALVVLLSCATLAQDALGVELGIDEALFRDDPGAVGTSAPGRMSPLTALAFLLTSAALILIVADRLVGTAQGLALAAAGGASLTLVRHLFDVGLDDGPVRYTRMALHTSLAFQALAAGLLLLRPERGLAGVVASPWLGGVLARRLLPWVISVPVAIGWLRLAGERAGLYDATLGVTAHVVASTAVLLVVVLWSAQSLSRMESRRAAAESALDEEQQRFRATFEQAAVGIAHVAPDGRWLRVNQRLCDIVGYTRDELMAGAFQDITHPEDLQADLELVGQTLSGRQSSYSMEKRYITKAGGTVWINLTVSLVREASGEPKYFISVVEDIGARKRAEQALRDSEHRYRQIFESVPVSLWQEEWSDVIRAVQEVTQAGVDDFARYLDDNPAFTMRALRMVKILDVNEHTLRMFKAGSKEEMLASLETVFSTEDTLPGFVGELVALAAGKRLYETEMALRTVGGELIHVLLTMLFPTPGAGSGEVLVSLMEITERKAAERALLDSEIRFRRAVSEAPIPMIIHDEDDRILHMSKGWTRYSGYSPEDLPTIGEWTRRAYGERQGMVKEYVDRLFELQETAANGEWTIRTKAGGTRTWDFHTTPLGLGADGRRLLLSLAVDVTERKEAEASLARYAAELERSNQDLQEFAFVASHDLQEPLRKIVAFGDRLRSRASGLDEQSRDYLERMERAAARMGTLIESLLELSRVATRAEPFRPVDLGAVASEVLADLEVRIRETGARVELGPLPTVSADRPQMRQLLQNLLVNALKFHEDGKPPHVRVDSLRRDAQSWEIRVADDGIGFDEKYLDRIFKPFQRLQSRREYEGSGMGLSICRKIAVRHGGEITARSRPGAGTTFTVTLPATGTEGG